MIEVYGKDGCDYCEKAVSLLNERQMKFTYYELGQDISIDEFKVKFNNNYVETRYDPSKLFLAILKEIDVKKYN